MKILHSGAALSKIVRISENLRQLERRTGRKYLPLNRGVNMVCSIDLNRITQEIDFNSDTIQVYPASRGTFKLRQAIGKHLFLQKSDPDHILVTAGGMNALDLIIQTLDVKKVHLPAYHWENYGHILNIRQKAQGTYFCRKELTEQLPKLRGDAVLICDPGNPLGEKYDDRKQFALIKLLNDNDIPVIFDSPYRRLFSDPTDDYYARLAELPNVVICESFSKSLGISGQRIGFIHTPNKELYEQLHIRLMYCTNGINGFAQEVVWRLLDTPAGQEAVDEFRQNTITDIRNNLDFLKRKNLLAEEFYEEAVPQGIFTVVKCPESELLEHRIGSVCLSFFTKEHKVKAQRYSRICVSYPHDEFVEYFLPVSAHA